MPNGIELGNLAYGAIDALINFEKTCAKQYSKMNLATLTPELAKALHPEQTEINSHIKRLGLIKKLLIEKSNQVLPIVSINKIKLKKDKSLNQDIYISYLAQQLQETKLSQYEFLLQLIQTLKIETAKEIVEQCIAENNATSTWIKRTLANLLTNI